MAASFTSAKTWKPPRHPSVGKWTSTSDNRILFITKKLLSNNKTWRKVKCIWWTFEQHGCELQVSSDMHVKVAHSCPTLCDPMDYTVHGILQARILEWVSFPFSREYSQPRDGTQVSHIAGGFFTRWATREALVKLICMFFSIVNVIQLIGFMDMYKEG